ncbi:MAG TPA: S8 family serine peptidase, partial [Gemmatimonadales bacterium]|nr:S8 family serine peptidase [Gemmatimonadales bacterium]
GRVEPAAPAPVDSSPAAVAPAPEPAVPDAVVAPPPRPREIPAEEAAAADWLSLGSTRVREFRRSHPTYDGRGVLIAILDSGIDPTVPGLQRTSTGERKILDLRDFSGEGAVVLTPLEPRGDTVAVAGRRLLGFGRVAEVAAGPAFGGLVAEIPLGEPPAADLNGNGQVADTLILVVTRARDGWVLFADTDGDGSLANERPVRDYAVAHESFGWAPRGQVPPIGVVVNFREGGGSAPRLDLLFDTSGHGTHVAGIAAGNDIYGVAELDGVAPGAQLIGLKISNNAQGGISTTGSMVEAIDYAIRFAAARRLPLVLNMSFGVGNEREGAARIDRIVDSVLAAHPELVFTISAGNDGPGLSTVGFPGSAERIISVGATYPGVFLPPGRLGARSEVVAFFSSRGGPLALPHLVTPGMAYSTVPRWKTGEERSAGTSMAAPHAAGLAASLLSGLGQEGRSVEGRLIRHALMVTARPVPGYGVVDQGAGVPDLGAAYAWLAAEREVPEVRVRVAGDGVSAAWHMGVPRGPTRFELRRPGRDPVGTFTLRSDAPWLVAPESVTLRDTLTVVEVSYRSEALAAPGVHTGVVTGWTRDTAAGPIFRLVSTVVVPHPAGRDTSAAPVPVAAGGLRRFFFAADSARPFMVEVFTAHRHERALAHLHEPGGMPFRDETGIAAGSGEAAAIFQTDGRDAIAGVYEAVASAAPNQPTSVGLRVTHSPLLIDGARERNGVVVRLRNVSGRPVEARVRAGLTGGERVVPMVGFGGETRRIPFVVPAWASRAEIDVAMAPEQWPRFTDFGVTLFDSGGRQLGQSPMNYAFNRLQVAFPEGHGDMPVELGLFPGLAEVGSTERWTARVSIRLYADSVGALAPLGRADPAAVAIAPGATDTLTYGLEDSPWPLGDGFVPLGIVAAEVGPRTWTRELRLPRPTPPLMR